MSSATYQWTDYQAHTRDELESGDHDLVVLRTGYGGGKSRCGAQWIHRGAIVDTEGKGESVVMAQDYEKGKSTTYAVFFKSLPGDNTNPFKDGDAENSPIVKRYNKNDKRIVYQTGHTVWLGGADKWSRFAGGEFSRIWCDEVAHYPPRTNLYDLYRMLITRQRTEVGPNSTLWTSTGNGYNQFYDITERQVDEDDEPLHWANRMHVVRASTEHNTLLPPDGLEKIVAQYKGTALENQGLHGGFAAAQGLVYDNFGRRTHVKPRSQLLERVGQARLYGYDYGHSDPRVLLEAGMTGANQYAILDVYYEEQKPVEHLVGRFDDGRLIRDGWIQTHQKEPGVVYCDHDPEHITKFNEAGFNAVKAPKSLDDGIDEVRSVVEVDESLGEPGLLVAEECIELIHEMQSYKEEDVGTSRATDHAVDSLRYLIMGDRYGDSLRDLDDLGWGS